MNKAWYIAIAAIVIIGAFLLFAPASAPNGAPAASTPVAEERGDFASTVEVPEGIVVESIAVHTVRATADGFVPAALTVKKGDSVTWVNESGRNVWPASAMHPTHTVYPASGIEKCGTSEAATIFDACSGIPTGNSWSFVFDEVGTWKYHDHLRASVFGSVTVE